MPGIKVFPAFICKQCKRNEGQPPQFIEFQPDTETSSGLWCEKLHSSQPSQGQQYIVKRGGKNKFLVHPMNMPGLCDGPLS